MGDKFEMAAGKTCFSSDYRRKVPKVRIKAADESKDDVLADPDRGPPRLASFTKNEQGEFSALLSLFLALPREELLHIMKAATSVCNAKLGENSGHPLHTCTG